MQATPKIGLILQKIGSPKLTSLSAAFVLSIATFAAPAQTPSLMPQVTSLRQESGVLAIDPGFSIRFDSYTDLQLRHAVDRFREILSRRTGITVWNPGAPSTVLHIRVAGPSLPRQTLAEDESYQLAVTSSEITLTSANSLGAMHGLQTLLQLIAQSDKSFVVPAVTIEDKPRFPWRGLMLDCSRHYMPMDVIERTLDGMEAVKLNVFHWHLSDDQGFRAELHSLPLLTERGSDGQYYSQEQMRLVVAYARDRGIRVVPEIDMPAHVSALLAAYPSFGSGSAPYSIERKWGIFNPALDPTREETYTFINKLFAELTTIFPDAYVHIGGDECNGKEWDANPRIRRFMQDHKIPDDAALQAYFSMRVQKIVAAHGKIPIGWDEILQPDTATNVVIQSWHGSAALAAAAKSGHKAILSKGYYLDLNLSAADHYDVDPFAGETLKLSPEQQANIIGGEAAMWTEYVSIETVESRIWPRLAVIAERLWTPENETTDSDNMYRRLAIESRRLELYNLQHLDTYPRMLHRLNEDADLSSMKTLGDVEEPPKQHARARLGTYTAFTPLNQMVDAIQPESSLARQFADLCARIAEGKATPDDYTQAQELLKLWEANDARLSPSLALHSLTSDLGPASASLSNAATIGLAALDLIENHHVGKAEWQASAERSLAEDAKPHAALVLAIVKPIDLLVRATATSQ